MKNCRYSFFFKGDNVVTYGLSTSGPRPSQAIGVQFILREGKLHVVIISEIKHVSGHSPHLDFQRVREGAVLSVILISALLKEAKVGFIRWTPTDLGAGLCLRVSVIEYVLWPGVCFNGGSLDILEKFNLLQVEREFDGEVKAPAGSQSKH